MLTDVVSRAADSQAMLPALKLPVGPEALRYKDLPETEFWRRIPAYADIDVETFADHKWQATHSISRVDQLFGVVDTIVSNGFLNDARLGFALAPMSVRISPYLISLIDWSKPYGDPIRRQFVPVGSALLPDHPMLGFDSLNEQVDAPVPGLTHRYPDKALFLALNTCPVYCRFCTRSYAVGIDTEQVEKVNLRVSKDRWKQAFDYTASRPELEDIVVSGGDAYQLRPTQITEIGEAFLSMDNVRRIRFASKGPAVMPQKILTDLAWRDALVAVVDKGRRLHKEVVLHTHFNHPNEITYVTKEAMGALTERGVTVRNQCVLQRGVNDTVETMTMLVKRLGYMNVHPYYVYMSDLVKGVEDLRTSLETALRLEKHVRGSTAGFNTPTFVVDAPGGGGKRDVHSFEHYNRETGVSVYTSPAVKEGAYFTYFDPLWSLSPATVSRWRNNGERDLMVGAAVAQAQREDVRQRDAVRHFG